MGWQALLPTHRRTISDDKAGHATRAFRPFILSANVSGLLEVLERWDSERATQAVAKIGSPGQTRTDNPSVNSRMLYH